MICTRCKGKAFILTGASTMVMGSGTRAHTEVLGQFIPCPDCHCGLMHCCDGDRSVECGDETRYPSQVQPSS